ncbi:hypothetical protein, partial [Streptomyces sp. URMC 123]|uniref:hypothetical protein n=1 Tax=Streptomyces sp. URMC 123 TaxID=3423403 RepID=UPI003F1D086D
RYLDSPYPTARLRARVGEPPRPARRVLVVGSHQSAVDAALLLCRDGHRTTMTSPSGRLPAVRTSLALPTRPLPPLERIAGLDPADPLLDLRLTRRVVEAVRLLDPRPLRRQVAHGTDPAERLREEIRLVEEGACAWPGVVLGLMEALIELGPALTPAERGALLARHQWFVGRYATAMTVVNARRLLAHFDAGALRLRGYPARIEALPAGWRVTWQDGTADRFDHVVNATGFHLPEIFPEVPREVPEDFPEARRGGVRLLDPPPGARPLAGLGPDLRVRGEATAAPERIWVVGVGTHPRVPFSNHLRNVTRQARHVARQLCGAGQL